MILFSRGSNRAEASKDWVFLWFDTFNFDRVRDVPNPFKKTAIQHDRRRSKQRRVMEFGDTDAKRTLKQRGLF